jgi:hypothetical protein
MKKTVLYIASFVLMIGLGGGVFFASQSSTETRSKASGGPSLVILTPTSRIAPNQTTTVYVDLSPGSKKVTAADIALSVDDGLEIISIAVTGTLMPQTLLPGTVDSGKKKATITLGASPTTPVTAGGRIVAMVVKATASSGAKVVHIDAASRLAAIGYTTSVLEGKTPGTLTIVNSVAPSVTPRTVQPTKTQSIVPTKKSSVSPTATVIVSRASPTVAPPSVATYSEDKILVLPETGTVTNQQLSGEAPNGSTITIVIHSDPVEGVVSADTNGTWVFQIPSTLPPGDHMAEVTVRDPYGVTKTVTKSFNIPSSEQLAAMPITDTAPSGEPSVSPFSHPLVQIGLGIGGLLLLIIGILVVLLGKRKRSGGPMIPPPSSSEIYIEPGASAYPSAPGVPPTPQTPSSNAPTIPPPSL